MTKHKTRFAGGPEDKTLFNGGELDPGQILKECGGTLDVGLPPLPLQPSRPEPVPYGSVFAV